MLAAFGGTEFLDDLLWAFCQRLRRGPTQDGRWEIRLDELVEGAATNAAYRDPGAPLDQRRAHDAYFSLFKALQEAGFGAARSGRRGKPTRFEFASTVRPPDVKAAFDSPRLRRKLEPREKLDLRLEQKRMQALAATWAALKKSDAVDRAEPPAALSRDEVIRLLKTNAAEARRLGVRELSLFGSLARNEARPDSDVDLLVEFDGPVTSQKFFDTKFFLEDLLGRRIDLVTSAALHPGIRKEIAPELIRVA